MSVSVIVVQSALGASRETAQKLKAIGLEQGKDFVAAAHPEDVERAFAKDEPQLLIIGTQHGFEESTAHFVKKAKAKNAKLVVWFYSGMLCNYPETYDRVITGLVRPSIPELVRLYLSSN